MDSSNGGISPADFAAMSGNMNNDNWFVWMMFLFFICGGNGGFGWGNRSNNQLLDSTLAASAAQGGYVTSNQMNDALRLQSIQQGQRDITDAINSNKYDIVNANSATEARLIANQNNLLANQAANAQAQQACCADVKYNSAMNTASINENTNAQVQKVLDVISNNRMNDLQMQNYQKDMRINQLEQNQFVDRQLDPLRQQMFMTTKYPNPNSFSYNAGPNPFCACGCGTTV